MMTSRSASSQTMVPISQEILDPAFCSRLGKAFAEGLTIESLKMRPMRRRPGSRHAFSCDLIVADQLTGKRSSIELIGKRDTRRGAGKAAREFEAMRVLWDAGFGADERFRIPRPVQHCLDLQLILQGKARGSKLRAHLGKGTEASLDHARGAGLWLAKLHNLKVSPPQVCTYANEIAWVRMFVAALSVDQPKLALEIQRCAGMIEQSFASFQGVPAAMVHGDFHPDHIFVEKNFVTVIDFERFCASDPARDVGSFIAHMRIMTRFCGRALNAARREIDAFLESYFSAVPLTQGIAVAPRIGPYVALSSLEALYYVASVLKVVDSGRIGMYMNCLRESELRATESDAPCLAALATSVSGERFSVRT
jgi:hypothetical protein